LALSGTGLNDGDLGDGDLGDGDLGDGDLGDGDLGASGWGDDDLNASPPLGLTGLAAKASPPAGDLAWLRKRSGAPPPADGVRRANGSLKEEALPI
jgi:hypothetical protein